MSDQKDTNPEVEALELRAIAAGGSVSMLCDLAQIDRATYQRWKANVTGPRLDNWRRLVKAVEMIEGARSVEAARARRSASDAPIPTPPERSAP